MDEPNDSEGHDSIRRRAYAIWLAEGQPDGRAEEHWRLAIVELEQEAEQAKGLGSQEGGPIIEPQRATG
jgi:hypothetical protein